MLYTIRTYPNLIPAQLAQARLRSVGIEAIVPEESSATAGYGSVVGGVRVQVAEDDRDEAEAVLADEEPPGDDAAPDGAR